MKFSPSFLSAFRFFRDNAGGVVGEHALCALHLARAEMHAEREGWVTQWEHEETVDLGDHAYWCGAAARGEKCEHEVLVAVLRDECGAVLASVGNVIDPSRSYGRVVEAELALEAMTTE